MSESRKFLVAAEEGYSLGSTDDALLLIGNLHGWVGVLLTEEDLAPDFFNLRTGLAGELLQKFVNYRVRVAIVLPDPDAYGERFAELAWEHRTHPLIRFFPSRERAEAWLGA
ncbi:MAG: DUF4180 domain-containing protein [Candidatus Promineifilaceae bacterium]|nr:DUF4180 domain-containing protein [Candidatus Promineifilaceae bacterium]